LFVALCSSVIHEKVAVKRNFHRSKNSDLDDPGSFSFARAHYNIGVLFGRMGDYRAESQAYMRAIRLKPDYAKAYCNLGVAYAQTGFYSKAVWAFENAVRLAPNDTVARQNLTRAYAKIKGMSKQQ